MSIELNKIRTLAFSLNDSARIITSTNDVGMKGVNPLKGFFTRAQNNINLENQFIEGIRIKYNDDFANQATQMLRATGRNPGDALRARDVRDIFARIDGLLEISKEENREFLSKSLIEGGSLKKCFDEHIASVCESIQGFNDFDEDKKLFIRDKIKAELKMSAFNLIDSFEEHVDPVNLSRVIDDKFKNNQMPGQAGLASRVVSEFLLVSRGACRDDEKGWIGGLDVAIESFIEKNRNFIADENVKDRIRDSVFNKVRAGEAGTDVRKVLNDIANGSSELLSDAKKEFNYKIYPLKNSPVGITKKEAAGMFKKHGELFGDDIYRGCIVSCWGEIRKICPTGTPTTEDIFNGCFGFNWRAQDESVEDVDLTDKSAASNAFFRLLKPKCESIVSQNGLNVHGNDERAHFCTIIFGGVNINRLADIGKNAKITIDDFYARLPLYDISTTISIDGAESQIADDIRRMTRLSDSYKGFTFKHPGGESLTINPAKIDTLTEDEKQQYKEGKKTSLTKSIRENVEKMVNGREMQTKIILLGLCQSGAHLLGTAVSALATKGEFSDLKGIEHTAMDIELSVENDGAARLKYHVSDELPYKINFEYVVNPDGTSYLASFDAVDPKRAVNPDPIQ